MRKLLLLIPLVLCASVAHAQTLVAHGICGGASACGTAISINTTGANFIAYAVSNYNVVASPTVTDSQSGSSNTYTCLTKYVANASTYGLQICYTATVPAHVGTSHTFNFSCTGCFSSIAVQAWSGMAASSVFQSGTDVGAGITSGNSLQPGSITPSGPTVVITAFGIYAATATASINSSYTISDQVSFVMATNEGVALAYLIQSSGSATNPLWSSTATNSEIAAIAAFKYTASAVVKRKSAGIF
jgi:hypothetical protein